MTIAMTTETALEVGEVESKKGTEMATATGTNAEEADMVATDTETGIETAVQDPRGPGLDRDRDQDQDREAAIWEGVAVLAHAHVPALVLEVRRRSCTTRLAER